MNAKSGRVCVTAVLRAKAGQEEAFLPRLRAFMQTLDEPGLLLYTLHRSATDPRDFLFYEEYADEAAFAAHTASPALAAWVPIRDQFVESRELRVWRQEASIGPLAEGNGD